MKIYTKGGDKGRTATYGGPRVSKSNDLMHALGSLDQATVWLGQIRTLLAKDHLWQLRLQGIQANLMEAMAEIASLPDDSAKDRITADLVAQLEGWIDETEDGLKSASQYFLMPGGNQLNLAANHARCSVREGERYLAGLVDQYELNPQLLAFINRLSDLMFSIGRLFLEQDGLTEEQWKLFVAPKR